jgi:REP element-mobilizing transposase RayT
LLVIGIRVAGRSVLATTFNYSKLLSENYSKISDALLNIGRYFSTMSEGFKIHKQEAAYFLTLQVVYWIDLFSRKRYRDIMIDSLNYCCMKKGLTLYSYVIMTNHIHMIVSADNMNLSAVIRDMKSFTCKQLIASIFNDTESRREWMIKLFRHAASRHKRNTTYQIWTHENHAEECYSPTFTWTRINYIHENPVHAGIVKSAEDYIYSSASDYTGIKGLVPICILHPHFTFS